MLRHKLAVGGVIAAASIALGIAAGSAGQARQASNTNSGHPGEKAYNTWCAGCHSGQSDAPSTEAVRQLSRANIRYTLELGYMKEIAHNVPREQIQQIIDWLPAQGDENNAWTKSTACKGATAAIDTKAPVIASTFGLGPRNNRAQTAAQTGLKKADMKTLELAWTIAFPATATMRSQPVIVGKTLFIAATDPGHIYALDTGTGCVKWTYTSDLTLRSSLSYAAPTKTTPGLILAGDAGGRVHAVDAKTGKERWVSDVKLHPVNRITGAPVVSGGKVFAPLSAIEVNYAGPDNYECCQGQGAVVALDLNTGKKLWLGRTMDDAKPTRKGRTGVQQWGPSGAIIWSTPVIDEKRQLIYVGTGENTSWPATETSDAIIAYDMKTGARRWVFQATKADIWNYACGARGANCDWPGEYQSPDHDFGATPMLITLKSGKDLVVGGQKAGVLWAIDPDSGKMVWSNKVARGSAGGGMRWGLAYDGELIYAPQNDPAGPVGANDNPNWGVALHAVNATTGQIIWTYKPNARDCGDMSEPVARTFVPPADQRMRPVQAPVLPPARVAAPGAAPAARPQGAGAAAGRAGSRCRMGLAAAPLLIDGAVVVGGNGGMLRIFDGKSGDVLFEYQTNKPYPNTINGVPGKGGSLDSAPYVAGNGTLFVQSGYARFGQPPGNVLLAFRPKGKAGK